MKHLITKANLLFAIVGALFIASPAKAAVRNYLNADDTLTSGFFTLANTRELIRGLNGHPVEPLSLDLIPPLPESRITGLTTDLAGKAGLTEDNTFTGVNTFQSGPTIYAYQSPELDFAQNSGYRHKLVAGYLSYTDRTIILPDADGTIALQDGDNTFSGANQFTGNTEFYGFLHAYGGILGDGSGITNLPASVGSGDATCTGGVYTLLAVPGAKSYRIIVSSGATNILLLPAFAQDGALIRTRIEFPATSALTLQVQSSGVPLLTQTTDGTAFAVFGEFSFHQTSPWNGNWILDQARYTK